MNLPAYLFISGSDGSLYDTRQIDWHRLPALRKNYRYTFGSINSLAKLKATLRAGESTWPGGYPLFLFTQDGGALCFTCARKEFKQLVWDYLHHCSTGWKVVGCEINYEDTGLYCDHCSKQIPSAYGEDEAQYTDEKDVATLEERDEERLD